MYPKQLQTDIWKRVRVLRKRQTANVHVSALGMSECIGFGLTNWMWVPPETEVLTDSAFSQISPVIPNQANGMIPMPPLCHDPLIVWSSDLITEHQPAECFQEFFSDHQLTAYDVTRIWTTRLLFFSGACKNLSSLYLRHFNAQAWPPDLPLIRYPNFPSWYKHVWDCARDKLA